MNEASEKINTVVQQLNTIRSDISKLQKSLKEVDKVITKEIKQISKKNRKPSNIPSGIAKPMKVSKELCMFMSKDEGSEIPRTEVTRFINKYIKDNQLQDETNKTFIRPDECLISLLNLSLEQQKELTYFNIQKYMNIHFVNGIQNNV